DSVDAEVVDAARGMGMSGGQVLARVELPLAVPLIFAGVRTASVFVLSTTTIASLAGFSGSLGDIIANETSYHFSGVLGAAICVAGLTLAVDALLALLQRALTPPGLRLLAQERQGSTRLVRALAAGPSSPTRTDYIQHPTPGGEYAGQQQEKSQPPSGRRGVGPARRGAEHRARGLRQQQIVVQLELREHPRRGGERTRGRQARGDGRRQELLRAEHPRRAVRAG